MDEKELENEISRFVDEFRPKAFWSYKDREDVRTALKLLVGKAQLFGRSEAANQIFLTVEGSK